MFWQKASLVEASVLIFESFELFVNGSALLLISLFNFISRVKNHNLFNSFV